MTSNQIAYWQLQENVRHNISQESETSRANRAKEAYDLSALSETTRHNVASESEASRHNIATEAETKRTNKATEKETQRHNKVLEQTDLSKLNETQRHNKATEKQQASELAETVRSNKTREKETERSNKANEAIGNRNAAAAEVRAQAEKEKAAAAAKQAQAAADQAALALEKFKFDKEMSYEQIRIEWSKLYEQMRHNSAEENIQKIGADANAALAYANAAYKEVETAWYETMQNYKIQLDATKAKEINAQIAKIKKDIEMAEKNYNLSSFSGIMKALTDLAGVISKL